MTDDQLTFGDPVKKHPKITPPKQKQPSPGTDAELTPAADHGEQSYRGTGRLEGRKALVTGGDSGIGAAVAIAFAREGADVVIGYLPDEKEDAAAIVEAIKESGQKATALAYDITTVDNCRALVTDAVEALGGIDILVNNAGKQQFCENLEELSDAQFDETLRTNVYAMFWITKAALPHLPAGSSIINTTSIQAYLPSPILVDYATTKGAINTFSKALAAQLGPRGIRVNAVAPGPIWTPLQVSGGQPQDKLPDFGSQTAFGRPGQPVELAPAYVFLASAESSYVTGETLNVNGGMPSP